MGYNEEHRVAIPRWPGVNENLCNDHSKEVEMVGTCAKNTWVAVIYPSALLCVNQP